MSNIRKKLLAFVCLYIFCSQLQAQVAPQTKLPPMPPVQPMQANRPAPRVTPLQRDYNWYVEEMRKRRPAAKPLSSGARTGAANPLTTDQSYQYMQQLLAKRLPSFRQNRYNRLLSAPSQPLPSERPYAWYEQMVRERLARLHVTAPPVNPVMP